MYRSIDAKFWTDPKIRELSPAHKLLFLYCITNSHSHVSGIYYMPKVLMQHETGLSASEIEKGIDTLSRAYLCLYDSTTEVLWVRHMLRYQHHGEKIRLAVASQLESLHKCPLIKVFLDEYADIKIPYRYPIDTRAPEERTGTGTGTGTDLATASVISESSNLCEAEEVAQDSVGTKTIPKAVWPSPEAFYALYDASVPEDHPRWTMLDQARLKKIRSYLKLYPDEQFWKQVFEEVSQSPFLRGRVSSHGRRPQKRGLDWLLTKGEDGYENCVKTYEGKYRNTFVSTDPSNNGVVM